MTKIGQGLCRTEAFNMKEEEVLKCDEMVYMIQKHISPYLYFYLYITQNEGF